MVVCQEEEEEEVRSTWELWRQQQLWESWEEEEEELNLVTTNLRLSSSSSSSSLMDTHHRLQLPSKATLTLNTSSSSRTPTPNVVLPLTLNSTPRATRYPQLSTTLPNLLHHHFSPLTPTHPQHLHPRITTPQHPLPPPNPQLPAHHLPTVVSTRPRSPASPCGTAPSRDVAIQDCTRMWRSTRWIDI